MESSHIQVVAHAEKKMLYLDMLFKKYIFPNSLSEGLNNGGIALLHRIDGHSHGRVTNHIQS